MFKTAAKSRVARAMAVDVSKWSNLSSLRYAFLFAGLPMHVKDGFRWLRNA